MQCTYFVMKWALVLLWLSAPVFSENFDDETQLNLDETSDQIFNYGLGRRHAPLTGYGSGGYGDPLIANGSLNVCQNGEQSSAYCTSSEPDLRVSQWRFITGIGWRKFTAYGAARKDWWEFKQQIGSPFTYRKYRNIYGW